MHDIRVDVEFESLIPALTPEELAGLEKGIVRDGCLSPLIVWREQNILLDGHNRKMICERCGTKYSVQQISLPDRDAAIQWIILNQFGRRNLQPFQRAELALRMEPIIAAKAKERMESGKSEDGTAGGRGKKNPMQISAQGTASTSRTTRAEVAKTAGVSHDTITKAKVIAEKAPEEVKAKLRTGKTTINKEYKAIVEPKASKADPVATDAVGNVLPDKLVPVFARVQEIKSLQREVSRIKGDIVEAAAKPKDPIFGKLDVSAVEADLKHVFGLLKAITPYAVCPYCKGGERGGADKCSACKAQGWVDEFTYRAAPKEMKA